MIEELRSKSIEEQIEILKNPKLMNNIMQKVDAKIFKKYMQELNEKLNKDELIEIIINNNELIPYFALPENENKLLINIKKALKKVGFIIPVKKTILKILENNTKIIDKFNNTQINKYFEEIKELIIKEKYYVSSQSSGDLQNNVELVTLSLKKNPFLLYNLSERIIEQIPKENIENAIKNGLEFNQYIPEIIKNNPDYVSIAIDYCDPFNLTYIISNLTEQGLTVENLKKAIRLGYKIDNEHSPFFLKQYKYIKCAIEEGQVWILEYLDINKLIKEE
jgi:hypothetical protein